MAKPTNLYRFSSLLMASLFAYSASVQLNDADWYFWFPLYACACIVNVLINWIITSKSIRHVAEATHLLAMLLHMKVVAESFIKGIAGLSLDLSERVVREKIGSGLVIISMVLHLIASSPEDYARRRKIGFPRYAEYGTVILVGFSYGLPCA